MNLSQIDRIALALMDGPKTSAKIAEIIHLDQRVITSTCTTRSGRSVFYVADKIGKGGRKINIWGVDVEKYKAAKAKESEEEALKARAIAMYTKDVNIPVKDGAALLGCTPQKLHVMVKHLREKAGVIKHKRAVIFDEMIEKTCNGCHNKVMLPRYIFNCGCINQNSDTGIAI